MRNRSRSRVAYSTEFATRIRPTTMRGRRPIGFPARTHWGPAPRKSECAAGKEATAEHSYNWARGTYTEHPEYVFRNIPPASYVVTTDDGILTYYYINLKDTYARLKHKISAKLSLVNN